MTTSGNGGESESQPVNGGNGNGKAKAIECEVLDAPRRGRGRPSLWKPEYLPEIRKRVFLGVPEKFIAAALRVEAQTFIAWKREHPEIQQEIDAAVSDCVAANLLLLKEASKDPRHWPAAAWLLERKFPQYFAKTLAIEETKIPAITKEDIEEAEKKLKLM